MLNRSSIQSLQREVKVGDGRDRPLRNFTATTRRCREQICLFRAAKAFSLIELVIVVVILGALAAIALPNYNKAKEHALGKEAIANLKIIAAAERIIRLETGNYAACNCSTAVNCAAVTGCNSLLSLDLSTNNWAYSVTLDGGSGGFYAQADRQGAGGYFNCAYRIQANTASGEPFVQVAPCP